MCKINQWDRSNGMMSSLRWWSPGLTHPRFFVFITNLEFCLLAILPGTEEKRSHKESRLIVLVILWSDARIRGQGVGKWITNLLSSGFNIAIYVM